MGTKLHKYRPLAKSHVGVKSDDLSRLYRTARWTKRVRPAVLERDGYVCQMEHCNRNLAHRMSDLVADHIEPHRGDVTKFWDMENLQTLCRWCHSSIKQKMENRK